MAARMRLLRFALNTLETFLSTVNPALNSAVKSLSRLPATWITQRKSLTAEIKVMAPSVGYVSNFVLIPHILGSKFLFFALVDCIKPACLPGTTPLFFFTVSSQHRSRLTSLCSNSKPF